MIDELPRSKSLRSSKLDESRNNSKTPWISCRARLTARERAGLDFPLTILVSESKSSPSQFGGAVVGKISVREVQSVT